MFRSVLVANRGEIARRVFRTARRMGLRTVAVYSDADTNAAHVRDADAAVRIGPAAARESYLRMDAVLDAARESGAEAIHPGYGFLSENAEFAEAVAAAGLVWIGPPPAAIRAMGLKDAAKRLMADAGVPVTPGWLGDDQSTGNLAHQAEAVGFPVLIKAVAGGGGKGMKRADGKAEFADALASAQREAASAFGDDRVLIERYLTRPRHIEVQVFGDAHGSVVHLFERDCSLQRRHQKVIEEAPAPGMDAATREAVCAAAVRAAKAVDYVGAGTVEFIADASEGLRADRIFFMEMNTRLQVEHPVTEAVTGLDLVEWQFRVAAGEPLPLRQEDITLTGWAMEARLYAEDPAKGFLPSVGKLDHFRLPDPSVPCGAGDRRAEGAPGGELEATNLPPASRPGREAVPRSAGDGAALRIDSAVERGDAVTPFYDPMIAKLIARAPTREAAAEALAEACAAVEVWPVRTNAGFLVRCLEHPDFVSREVDTAFIPSRYDALTERSTRSDELAAVTLALAAEEAHAGPHEAPGDPWNTDADSLFGFRVNASPSARTGVSVDGRPFAGAVMTAGAGDRSWRSIIASKTTPVSMDNTTARFGAATLAYRRVAGSDEQFVLFDRGDAYLVATSLAHATAEEAAADGAVLSPMPGRIVAVSVQVGQSVEKGRPLVVLEAMKMEHALTAPFDGVVAELAVKAGDQVAEGVVLVRLEPAVAPLDVVSAGEGD